MLWPEHLQLPVSEENERAAIGDGIQICEAALATLGGSVQACHRKRISHNYESLIMHRTE